MVNKTGLEFSFSLIFAIIVGAVIIFLAIYAATSLIGTEKSIKNTEAGKQLGIILTPVETGIEAGKATAPIKFPSETRIYNDCKTDGNFGIQEIGISTKSGFGKTWSDKGIAGKFYNKYLFSSSIIEGREISIFTMPFEFPFKVADLVFLIGSNESYCFVNAPYEVKENIENLQFGGGLKQINFTSSASLCPKKSKKICFSESDCDIAVSMDGKSVRNGKKVVYFEGNLIYGAIFSDAEVYECQVKRLMKRTSSLSLLYSVKAQNVAGRGCNSNLDSELVLFANETLAMKNSLEFRNTAMDAETIGKENEMLSCKLF